MRDTQGAALPTGSSRPPLPWFMDSSIVEACLRRAPSDYTQAAARAFLRDGFVVLPQSVSPQVCDDAVSAFRRLESLNYSFFQPHQDNDGHYPRIVNLHLVSPELRRVFTENPQALSLQDYLFDAETVIYTSLFYERGSAQDIHRDTPYFCTRPEYRYLGMWVALEDADEANGPLMVVAGGHLMPELDREALATELLGSAEAAPAHSDDLWVAYQTRVTEQAHALGLTVKTVPVKKGSTIIWHPQLPHGGSRILDQRRTRFSVVMHTTPLDTPVYHQDAFFNPRRAYPLEPGWTYAADGGRRYARHGTISFNHQADYPIGAFSLALA
jgi:phytanoyl-CoA hydroxylase